MSEFKDMETIVGEVPYVEYAAKAFKILMAIYNFGKKSELEIAVEKLQEDVLQLKAEVQNLNARVDELNTRIVQLENKSRMSRIQDIHYAAVADLTFQLSRTPDTDELAIIANRAAVTIENMLADEDLWLWSDIRKGATPAGSEVLYLTPPEFKVIPLGVLGMAFAVFSLATALHLADVPDARQFYTARLTQFYDDLSVRPNWVDPIDLPKTLPEKIRASITVVPRPSKKYADNGVCEFGLEAINRIDRTSALVQTGVYVSYVDNDAFCMAPENLGLHQETVIEEDYPPIVLIETIRDALDRLRTRGTLADPVIPQFDDELAHQAVVFAVRPNGDMVKYTCDLTSHLRTTLSPAQPLTWKTSAKVVGTGWHQFWRVVSAGLKVFLGVTDHGSITWYRHDAVDAKLWTGPKDVSFSAVHHVGRVVEECFSPGGVGVCQVIRTVGGGGIFDRLSHEIVSIEHPDLKTGEGRFKPGRTIGSSWDGYRLVFGGGQTGQSVIIYAATNDGDLMWHRWTENPLKITEPRRLGSGFERYKAMFSTGLGFIFGIYPNGRMDAWYLENWANPERSTFEIILKLDYGDWRGPVPVSGVNWNGFLHVIPDFGVEEFG